MRSFASCGAFGALVACALLSGLGGCAAIQDALNLRRPSARLAGVGLRELGLDSATLLFDVEVENPYSVPLPLVNLDYGLSTDGKPFVSGSADIQGTVPAKSKKSVPLPAKVVFLEVLKALEGVRPGAVVPYTAEVGLSVDAPAVGRLRLPMTKKGELPIPAVPDVSIAEIKWDKLTLDEAGGRAKLNLVNRNQFPVDLSKFSYALSLGGVEVARSSIAKPVAFEANGGAGAIEIPISFSPKAAGLAVFEMLLGKGGTYGLAGTLDLATPFGPASLPIDKVGKTLFRR